MFSWSLDIHSLTAVLICVSTLLCVVLFLIWRLRKTYPGFGCWTAGNALDALGFLLMALRGMIPDLLSILLVNILVMSATVLFLEGVQRFRGVPSRRLFIVILMILEAAGITYHTYGIPDVGVRIIIFSVSVSAVSALVAWELLRNTPPGMRFSFRFTGSMFAAHALLLIVRALITVLEPTALHDLFTPNLIQTLTFLLSMLLAIAWTFGFVMLNAERLEMDLKNAQGKLERLADTDYLTGIANHRSFSEAGEREIQRARRYGHSLAVLLIDLDYFKQVNDTYGHAAGDSVLASTTAVIRKLLRDVDIFGRLGGEEFAILLPETDLEGGKTTAERLRTAVSDNAIAAGCTVLKITVSIGVTLLSAGDSGLDAVLKRADDAMYEAKRNGRNRIMVAPLPAATGSVARALSGPTGMADTRSGTGVGGR